MKLKKIAVAAVIATQTLGLAAMPVSAKSLPKMTTAKRKQLMDINIDTSQELCLMQNYQGIVVGAPEVYRNGKLIRLKKDKDLGTYVDTNVRNGKKYTYARKENGTKSSKSYTIYRVATPKIVSMKKKGNKMTVKWTKVPGATSYTVGSGLLTNAASGKTVGGSKTSATFTVKKPKNFHKSGKMADGSTYEEASDMPTDYSLLIIGATKKVGKKEYNSGYAGRYFWL